LAGLITAVKVFSELAVEVQFSMQPLILKTCHFNGDSKQSKKFEEERHFISV
jgi:hypothetical protein